MHKNKLNIIESRKCGSCNVCCNVAEVIFDDFIKPAHSKCPYLTNNCSIYTDSKRPAVCGSFKCSWLRGYGNDNDRPNLSNVMVSVNNFNGGNWIFVMETAPNAFRTTGKNIIIDIASKINLPVIIVYYESRPPNDKGDCVIVKKSLLPRSKQLISEQIGFLDESEEFGIYKLVVN